MTTRKLVKVAGTLLLMIALVTLIVAFVPASVAPIAALIALPLTLLLFAAAGDNRAAVVERHDPSGSAAY